MKITVLVKPKSKIEKIEELEDGSFVVRVNALPIDGQANKRVIEMLAKHFKRPKSSIQLLSGTKGKKKLFSL